jgi:hypothetical protein
MEKSADAHALIRSPIRINDFDSAVMMSHAHRQLTHYSLQIGVLA